MKLESFNIEELSQIESLLQSSTNISEIYDKLCELEINNQKDSQEYEQLLTKLKKEIDEETKKYKDFKLTYKQCMKYAGLLASQAQIHLFDTKISTTLKNYNSRTVRRVLLTLASMIESSEDYQKSIIPKDVLDSILSIAKDIPKEDFIKGFSNNIKINTTLNTDINSVFLSILEEAISGRANKTYRSQLIQAKYCIAFAHRELETLLLPYKFEMTPYVYINSQIVNELLKEGAMSYDITRFVNLKSKASTEINRLLGIKDQEYTNPNVNVNSIITQCYIRALLSLMTGEEVDDFNQEFHDSIESPEYLKTHPTDRISESAIMYCFKCFNRDKGRTRTLSIKNDN